VSCKGCDEKARAHAELDALAQAWIAAGKLRGFLEGVEWTVRALTETLAPQAGKAKPWQRLMRTEQLVRDMGPTILERVAVRRAEAAQAESLARKLTSELRMPPPAPPSLRARARAAVLALLG